ncbi:MAG: hypothetical protein WCR52_18155, partial [Bacteroidota bacterium]
NPFKSAPAGRVIRVPSPRARQKILLNLRPQAVSSVSHPLASSKILLNLRPQAVSSVSHPLASSKKSF